MYYSLKGIVKGINKYQLVLDVHDVSYLLLVADISNFKIGDIATIFTHLVIKEEEQFLVGFSSLEIKKSYLLLNSISGIGPKTAIKILNNISLPDLYKAINDNNIILLKKIPGVSSKIASQLIFDLRNKVVIEDDKLKDIKIALRNLGFNLNDISYALNNVDTSLSKELILKNALIKLKR